MHTFAEHADAITDLLVVNDLDRELACLVSASLDSKIHVYSLQSLRHTHTLVGHTSGVRSISYDYEGGLYSGGFEYEVFVWDLYAGAEYPINKLVKEHSHSIVKVQAAAKQGRLASLDTSGRFCWWDSRRNVA
jgi:WD40 repeat protein